MEFSIFGNLFYAYNVYGKFIKSVPAGDAWAVTVGGGAVVDGAGAAAVAARATDAEGAHPDGV